MGAVPARCGVRVPQAASGPSSWEVRQRKDRSLERESPKMLGLDPAYVTSFSVISVPLCFLLQCFLLQEEF